MIKSIYANGQEIIVEHSNLFKFNHTDDNDKVLEII